LDVILVLKPAVSGPCGADLPDWKKQRICTEICTDFRKAPKTESAPKSARSEGKINCHIRSYAKVQKRQTGADLGFSAPRPYGADSSPPP
jgi:hypothetical protein